MRLASLVLDIATQALDRAYTYGIPAEMTDCSVGCCVLVPFGGRKALGYVVDVADAPDAFMQVGGVSAACLPAAEVHDVWASAIEVSTEVPAQETAAAEGAPLPEWAQGLNLSKVKHIEAVLSESYFDREKAEFAQFIAHEYLAPLNSCIKLFLPPQAAHRLVKRGSVWEVESPRNHSVTERVVHLEEAGREAEIPARAHKQRAVIEVLKTADLSVSELSLEFGQVSSTLKRLEELGYVSIYEKKKQREFAASAAACFQGRGKVSLNQAQEHAVASIVKAFDQEGQRTVLVDGVTGSGKTEVYLNAIAHALEQGKDALVLVPEISLTPQTLARFRERFGSLVALLHSKMSLGERFDAWTDIKQGRARVVVGARSALFAPTNNVGLIIIDEEHESTYKQDSAPRYDARRLATWLMERSGGVLVLGSATPSIESIHKSRSSQNWTQVELPERANGKPMPPVTLVDMAQAFTKGDRSMFSHALKTALVETLDAGHKAVLMLNQRGFSQFLLCRDCGFVPRCPSCDTSLTYHEDRARLICHHCGYSSAVPATCPECTSPYLKRFGAGTQRVEAELKLELSALGLEAPIFRMDADTTQKKGAHQRILESFASTQGGAILLGTQMVAKGLDFDDVVLVGVINADTQLNLPDFRASERTFALIEQVAGRAGRSELPGRVIIQSYNCESSAIQAAARYDRASFLQEELKRRQALRYPPFVRMANILIWGKNEEVTAHAAQVYYQDLQLYLQDRQVGDWEVYPATPCVLSRLRGLYRFHILIKAPAGADFAGILEPFVRQRKRTPNVASSIDIDAQSIL